MRYGVSRKGGDSYLRPVIRGGGKATLFVVAAEPLVQCVTRQSLGTRVATAPHRPARKTGWKHRRHILQELFHATLLKLLDHFFDLGLVFFFSHQRRVRRMHNDAILHPNGYDQVTVATAND